MKNANLKNVNSSILILFIGMFLFSSCEKDELITPIEEKDHYENTVGKSASRPTENSNYCRSYDRGACGDNLTGDGCNFTTGEGRDMPNQYLMVDMLDNCRTEPLPSNCSWFGNYTQTRTIEVDLSNCCFPAYALNSRLNSWKNLAVANKPNSSYVITDYERIYGFMVTSYGPYRMGIKVTYRKKICSIGSVDVIKK